MALAHIIVSVTARFLKAAAAHVTRAWLHFKSTREFELMYVRRKAPGVMAPMHVCACTCQHCTSRFCASHGRGVPVVEGNLVGRKSRRQSITTSTAESELEKAANAHRQSRSAELLMAETSRSVFPFELACDTTAALSMVGENAQLACTTHLRPMALVPQRCLLRFHPVCTADQRADGMSMHRPCVYI